MPRTLTALHERPFELQVWVVITAIGALRTLKSVVQNVVNSGGVASLAVDTFIFLTFVTVCVLIYQEKIRHVPVAVALIFMVLLTVSFVRLGGVRGTSEYNLMALSILFVVAYKQRVLIIILTVYFLLILTAILDLRVEGWMTRHLFSKNSTTLDTYFTSTLTLVAFFLYFKNALSRESARLLESRTTLSHKVRLIRRQHRELKGQQQLIHDINSRLAEEIDRHSRQIDTQNKAIDDFIWLSTQSLHLPLQRITAIARDLHEEDSIESKLKDQVAELRLVIHSLKEELQQHEKDRKAQ